jgi:parallel beta-helix repeat protein
VPTTIKTGANMIRVTLGIGERYSRFLRHSVLAAAAIACANANVLTVTTTIQAAIDAAHPGDTVRVPAGIYRENVRVNKDGITIDAMPGAVLNGTGLLGDTGITVSPKAPGSTIHGFTLSGIQIRNYSVNGVRLEKVQGFLIRGGVYTNNNQYGVFPVLSSNGTVELNTVSGANDTGIYIGQSTDILVRANVSKNCAIGFEVENSSRIRVEGNLATGNSTGIFVDVLPGLIVTSTSNVNVASNVVIGNNRPNLVTDPTDILFLLPSGAGILNVGGDAVVITSNEVFNNNTVGIGVIRLPAATAALDPRIDPIPDNNQVANNVALQNGSNPDPRVAPAPGSDLAWDGSGQGNCWNRNLFRTSFPALLPSCEH